MRPQEIIEIKGGKKEDSSKTDGTYFRTHKKQCCLHYFFSFFPIKDESLVNELLESVKNKLKDHKTSTMVKEEPNVKKIIPQDIVTSNNDQSAVESNSGEESLPKSYR